MKNKLQDISTKLKQGIETQDYFYLESALRDLITFIDFYGERLSIHIIVPKQEQTELYLKSLLKEKVLQCTAEQQYTFKRMYAKGNMSLNIEEVINNMDNTKIDGALQQTTKTLLSNKM